MPHKKANEHEMANVTMQQVAQAAGVHQTTVSLALRDHPRISIATKRRVREIADEMGYVPNPLVSALIASRKRRSSNIQATLGYIIGDTGKDKWPYEDLDSGIRGRVEELGFGLDTFWMEDVSLTRDRFSKITQTRDIRGLIVAPLRLKHSTLDIDWGNYAAVAYGYSMAEPRIHRVAPDFYHDMLTILNRCHAVGFRRVGLVLEERVDVKADHLWLAAFLAKQRVEKHYGKIPPLLLPVWSEKEIGKWFQDFQPDVVISLPKLLERLEKWWLDLRGLRDAPAWYSLDALTQTKPGHYAGTAVNRVECGRACVDLVVSMLYRNEVGIPKKAHNLLVEADWLGEM